MVWKFVNLHSKVFAWYVCHLAYKVSRGNKLYFVRGVVPLFQFFLYVWENNAYWIILNHFESILLFKKIILIYMYIYVGRKYVIYWPPPVPYILEENGWKNFFYYLMSYNYMFIMKDFFILKTKKFNNGFNSVWQCPVNNKYTCKEWSY